MAVGIDVKPLRPAIFSAETLRAGGWSECNATSLLWRHIAAVGKRFPSLTIAWAAHDGLEIIVNRLAEMLSEAGLNVFLPCGPVPIAALAVSLGERALPLGLYIDEVEIDSYSAVALTTHGGPVLESDIPPLESLKLARKGVIGTTDIIEPYLKRMSHLLDPLVESKVRLSSLSSPFTALNTKMLLMPAFRLLFECDAEGPSATISSDGQSLEIIDAEGIAMNTITMVSIINKYLTESRGASGTLIGPSGTAKMHLQDCDVIEVCGDALDMTFRACYTNLLLGWWEKGIIAHQGHAPFGDAYLTLLYLLESWNGVD